MLKFPAYALLAVALLAGCGDKKESSSGGSSSGGSSTPASKYGTPEDTAKAFFAACAAADWKALGECCSKTDEGIAEIRDGKLSDKEKENFKAGLGTAKVGAATKGADGKTADVAFTGMDHGKERGGTLKMVLEGSDWKVVDLK